MVRTPSKRTASSPPDGARPSKRLATSSPEEGELDDTSPPLQLPLGLPRRPPSPLNLAPAKPPVSFPFKSKRKNEPNGTAAPVAGPERAAVVYERPEDVQERIREREREGPNSGDKERHDSQGRHGSRHEESSRRSGPSNSGDHWEPSADHGRDRGSKRRGTSRESHMHGGDRYYPARESHRHSRKSHRDHIHGSHGRGRDRARSSHSPASGDRSRSSSTPRSSRRGKHRLPAHRTPRYTFTPPPREYNVDRRQDREREERGRYHDPDDGRSYIPGDIRYPPPRDWTQGDRIREPVARDDAHYRTAAPDNHRRDDRDWSQRRFNDSYRPVSPGRSSLPSRLPTYTSPDRDRTRTPPPPTSSPPPPPPPVDATLPAEHATISISIPSKRPAAPRDKHSPSPLPLPPATDADSKPHDREGSVAVPSLGKVVQSVPAIAKPRKRDPVQRSREEEKKFYKRVFNGCGKLSDYEMTTKLGEGTFGEVHKAIQNSTGKVVALKRILMHNESEGMPVTALREIKILRALNHPCIINILDMIVVRSKGEKCPLSVYMVFPYMDHDLAGLLENDRVKLQPSQIKLYMKQLLEGTEYMHRNNILHRDMKAANLLISNSGILRIADFGLARTFDTTGRRLGKESRYTNCVVTRWYRPPELLLGARQYGGEVDLWGIGCVLGEMFMRRPILPGTSDLDQLDKIWQLCGSPNQHNWPHYDELPGCEGIIRFTPTHSRKVKVAYESVGAETADLLDKLLVCYPRDRITARQALDHDYFWTDPLPADPKTLPSYEASHEFDKRGRRPPPTQGPGEPVHIGPPRYAGRPPPGHFNHPGGPHPPPNRDSFQNRPPPPGPPPPPHNLPPQMGRPGPPFHGPPPQRQDTWRDGPSNAWDGSHGYRRHPYPQHRNDQWGHHDRGPPRQVPPGNQWDAPKNFQNKRPAHLPPRPAMPLGLKPDEIRGETAGAGGGAELNYG